MCQCHGSVFDMTTGAAVAGPATKALTVYEVQEVEGSIQLRGDVRRVKRPSPLRGGVLRRAKMVRMLVMILVGVAIFVLGLATVWFLFRAVPRPRCSRRTTSTTRTTSFVAKGELVDRGRDRDAAWRDFQAWQLRNEQERSPWEESSDE